MYADGPAEEPDREMNSAEKNDYSGARAHPADPVPDAVLSER